MDNKSYDMGYAEGYMKALNDVADEVKAHVKETQFKGISISVIVRILKKLRGNT